MSCKSYYFYSKEKKEYIDGFKWLTIKIEDKIGISRGNLWEDSYGVEEDIRLVS